MRFEHKTWDSQLGCVFCICHKCKGGGKLPQECSTSTLWSPRKGVADIATPVLRCRKSTEPTSCNGPMNQLPVKFFFAARSTEGSEVSWPSAGRYWALPDLCTLEPAEAVWEESRFPRWPHSIGPRRPSTRQALNYLTHDMLSSCELGGSGGSQCFGSGGVSLPVMHLPFL